MKKNTDAKEKLRKKLYPIFRKEKINDKCIAFESLWGRSYSCNPAALYEYINENHPEYECVWFFNNTDIEIPGNAKKVKRGTEEHFYYLATAKYFIFNNNMPLSFKKREKQIIVQTMHGTPYKSFGLDVKEETETEEKALRVIERSAMWDYLIAQGEFTKKMAWNWFRYDKKILEIGYPRTDVLFEQDNSKGAKLRKTIGIPENKKVILYAPTWRKQDSFDMMLDIERMRHELLNEYVLMIRLHHFDAEYYKVPDDGIFVFDGGTVDKIEDLYAITDILITDYSSVMFDFALTKRPMIFYAYDIDEYTQQDRGSYFDIKTEAPGVVAETTEQVIAAIKGVEKFDVGNSNKIDIFRKKYLTYENPKSCEMLYDEVFVKQSHLINKSFIGKGMSLMKRVLPGRIYSKIRKAQLKRLLNNN